MLQEGVEVPGGLQSCVEVVKDLKKATLEVDRDKEKGHVSRLIPKISGFKTKPLGQEVLA